MKILIEYNKN